MIIFPTAVIQTIYAEVCGRDGNPVKEGPKAVQIVINESIAAQIRRCAQFVKENELYKVQRFDWPGWLAKMPIDTNGGLDMEKSPYRTTVETLNISADEFWYEAYVEDTDIEIISERVSIASLNKKWTPIPPLALRPHGSDNT